MSLSMFRRREWIVPVPPDSDLAAAGVVNVTVRALSMAKVDKATAESYRAAKDAYGDDYSSWREELMAARKDADDKGDDADDKPPKPEPTRTPLQRVRAGGFYPPALVRYGLVAVDEEKAPTADEEIRAMVDELPANIVGELALLVCIGKGPEGQTNGLLKEEAEDDRPSD